MLKIFKVGEHADVSLFFQKCEGDKCLPSLDAIAYSGAFFGAGSGPIHLDDVACTGSEAALINCTYDTITTDCSHSEDAGVQCQGNNTVLSTSLGLRLLKLLIACMSILCIFLRIYKEYLHFFIIISSGLTLLVSLQSALIMTSDLLGEQHRLRDVLSCVATRAGALCVMTCGEPQMLL